VFSVAYFLAPRLSDEGRFSKDLRAILPSHACTRQLQLNISLVRTADGRPKFFNCALSEVEENLAGGGK